MKIYFILTTLLLSACTTFQGTQDNSISSAVSDEERHDYHQLLSLIIKAKTPETSFQNADGTLDYDELKAFKLLDNLYKEYTTPKTSDGSYTNNQLRVIAFLSHLAHQQNNAALNEYLASDLLPIYRKSPQQFLAVLTDLPYLAPENCERISAYFEFEGNRAKEKAEFLDINTKTIEEILGSDLAKECLSHF